MDPTPLRRGAAVFAGSLIFGADRRTRGSLRIAACLAAAVFAACAPEPNVGTVPDEPAMEPAEDDTSMRDAAVASRSLRDAGSARENAPRDRAPPMRDSGPLPALDAAAGGGPARHTAPSGGGVADGSADAAPANYAASTDDAAPASDGGSLANDRRPEGVAECYSEFSKNHPAVLRQRDVFGRGDYAARPSMIEELAEAAAAYPDEEQFVLLSGLMRLWRVVEPDGLEAIDILGLLDATAKSEEDLRRAYALCPTDHRILGWLGPLLVKVARMLGDAETIEEGDAMLQQGAERYPDFVRFTQVLTDAVLPVSDPGFQRALEAIGHYRDRCGYTLEAACVNLPSAAGHTFEGSALYFGDTLAKMQDRDEALAWYTSAMQGPTWASWPFRDRIEQRIQRIDQRIAAAATPDSSDDEPFFESEPQCSLCHRESPASAEIDP